MRCNITDLIGYRTLHKPIKINPITSLLSVALLLMAFPLSAQFTYTIDQSIPVEAYGKTLSMPWVGGFNAVQVSTIDINGDGDEDLFVFDRQTHKVSTFLNHRDQYVYAPEYEFLFPDQLRSWVLLRDANCDGKKDLFTSNPFGIILFLNTTLPGGALSWRSFNRGKPLSSTGITLLVNIKVNASDMPAIDDIDNDGDLDILINKFIGRNTVEWHKNQSMEQTGTCDSLYFERVLNPPNWGEFKECYCGDFAFQGSACNTNAGNTFAYVHHSVSKALLTLDVDGDGDRELVLSEEECPNLFLLTNSGTDQSALMTDVSRFPIAVPISMTPFPASFLEDMDFDGRADLVVSPNMGGSILDADTFSFKRSVYLYKNTGTSAIPVFTFVKDNFLQDEMIDVGTHATPAFTDYDGDGDLDMFLGYCGNYASLAYYENTGTIFSPSFRLVTNDFMNLSSLEYTLLAPQFIDMNTDGNIDLVLSATKKRSNTNIVSFPVVIFGQSSQRLSLAMPSLRELDFSLRYDEHLCVVDVDVDGKMDMLVSRRDGAVEYWQNRGTGTAFEYVLENPDFINFADDVTGSHGISVMDLDADGHEDIMLSDRTGRISVYKNFRNVLPDSEAIDEIIRNPFEGRYVRKNLGGFVKPVAANLFYQYPPSIIVGTPAGGVSILKPVWKARDDTSLETDIMIYPNPVLSDRRLQVLSMRDAWLECFTMLGQKILSKPLFLKSGISHSLDLSPLNLVTGVYLARFTVGNRIISRHFVVR